MNGLPAFACPKCRGALEYQVTIEMVDTPVGKIDTAYCPRCAWLFEYVRETRTYFDSTQWPPLCRTCRQPVSYASSWVAEDREELRYECRDHPAEQWILTRGTNRWARTQPA